jgi:hypothetical protein
VIVFVASSSVLAFDYMGPPATQIKGNEWGIDGKGGQLGLGVDYMYSEVDIEIEDTDVDIEDVQLEKVYFRPSYGLVDGIEIYGLLGGAKAEMDDSDDDIGSSDMGFAGGFGLKATLLKKEKFSWGVLAQFTGTKLEDFSELDDTGIDLDMTLYEFQIATGPVLQITDSWSVYGGPFLHFIAGDIDAEYEDIHGSVDIEQDSPIGGFIGTQLKLTECIRTSAEFQATGSGYGIGGQLVFVF